MGAIDLRQPADNSILEVTLEEFRMVKALVYKRLGISLSDEKRTLVAGRLQSVLKRRGIANVRQYLEMLEKDTSGQLMSELTNQITTNHTFFFREREHFDFFSTRALPEAIDAVRRDGSMDLRLWCGACSTGEEAYTIQMLVMEHLKQDYAKFDAGLLATDVSLKVLTQAKEGIFTSERMAELPANLRRSYFKELGDGRSKAIDAVRNEIVFRRFNLMNEKYPFGKPFHVIFLRNVMIYFDEPTRRAVVQRMYDVMAPGGYLFVGHSESLSSGGQPFKYVMPAVYRKA